MKMRTFRKMLLGLLAVALLLVGVGTAAAEDQLLTDCVELFSEGAFPKPMPMMFASRSTGNIASYLLSQLEAGAEEIDVSEYQLTVTEFRNAYRGMLNAQPELFYVSGSYGYYTDGTYLTRVLPQYLYTGTELDEMRSVYNSGLSAILSYAKTASTPVGRMLRANDYICANYEYDTNYEIYSPELMFKHKRGVCQAYMLIYRAVLNELGISNVAVLSDEMNHTWNMVELGGEWYHVDVTWNDPVSDVPLRVYHNNFLLSDTGITNEGHYSWYSSEALPTASDTTYDDYFWRIVKQAFPMRGDVAYYADSDYVYTTRDIYAYDFSKKTVSKIGSYDIGSGSYYQDRNPLWITSDTIYYVARDALYAMPLAGGNPVMVYSTGNSEMWLWNPFLSGSNLKFYQASSPSGEGSVVTCATAPFKKLASAQALRWVDAGSTVALNPVMISGVSSANTFSWSSTNTNVASVNGNGVVTGIGAGVAKIYASYSGQITAAYVVIVRPQDTLHLPANTLTIQAEAFSGMLPGMIVASDKVETIGARAFADNYYLQLVQLPASVSTIAADAFSGSTPLTLLCPYGSAAAQYAVSNGISCVYVP